jgi:hypothetical protein
MGRMGNAIEVKQLDGWMGDARLFRLSGNGPLPEFVVVSATVVMYTGPETYIFASDADGRVEDFMELDGSYRGGLSHAKALKGAGYGIVYPCPLAPPRKH